MLGKRARQIQRTTSMSHLVPRLPSVGDSPLQPQSPNSVAVGQKILRALDARQDQSHSPQIVETVEDELGMEMNLDQISGHCDRLLLAEDSLTSDQIEECHTSLDRSTEKSSYISGQASSWSHHMVPVPMQAKYQDATSILPAEFLKMCFFCSRRLGHGQDIYIYRGDVAFCSEECRNHQILKDERKDKCSISASKKGSAPPPVKIESGGKAVSSGTAVGA